MTKYEPQLSAIFQALSDPTRRAMLAQLAMGPVGATELARPTGWALPTVLRHIAVLEAAALIDTEKIGRSRMCRLRPETLNATAGWMATQRAIWEAQTDRLQAYVETMMQDDPHDH